MGGEGPIAPRGVFYRGFARPWIALRADLAEPPPGSDNPYSLIQHEYAHLVVSLNFERVPPWLHEGVAELLGGTTVQGNGVALGRPIVSHLRLLRDRRLMPVESLFVVDHGSPEYSEEKRVGLFYAESWALVHYLILDPKASHDPRFKGFVSKVVEGMEPSAALRGQGINAAELDRALESYVRQLTYWQATLATPIESGGDFPTREISSAEWSAVGGAFLVDSGRMADGRRLLEQAERQQPDLASVQEALGVALYREGRLDEARERLERAARLDPARPTAHVLVALVMQRAGVTVETRRAARAHLEKALELAPEHALAHALLADSLLADGQAGPALEHALRAASLEPGAGQYRLSLALALAAAGRAAEAESQAQKALDLGLDNARGQAARELLQTLPAVAGKATEPAPPPAAATAPSGQPVAWGVFVNEDGAARATARDNHVEIRTAPGAYDLSAEIGNVNAPRLLRPVEGDFVAQVTVTSPPRPSPRRGSARRVAFNGAGLLLWQDEKNYVRLEFAAYVAGTGATVRYALFEQRKNGQPVGGLDRSNTRLEEAPASLRLERHDRTLVASVRQGENDWTPIGHFQEDLPRQIYVGVAAVNATQAPFVAEFEDFTISPRP